MPADSCTRSTLTEQMPYVGGFPARRRGKCLVSLASRNSTMCLEAAERSKMLDSVGARLHCTCRTKRDLVLCLNGRAQSPAERLSPWKSLPVMSRRQMEDRSNVPDPTARPNAKNAHTIHATFPQHQLKRLTANVRICGLEGITLPRQYLEMRTMLVGQTKRCASSRWPQPSGRGWSTSC